VVEQERRNSDSKVAEYWNEHTDETYFGETYWLANPVINRHHQLKAAGGRDYESWVNFSVQHFLGEQCPVERVLSIGSGDGALERHLASLNTARHIDGIDLAPKRIEIARQEAVKVGMQDTIHYSVCNVETNPFPGSDYDAIYFNSSLHHMSDLDAILSKFSAELKQDGYLFVNEYIGPNRFAFSDREKEVMQSVFKLIPEKYRVSHAEHDRGQIRRQMHYPDPAEVERVDPSEAIHSEEIVDALKRHFKIEEFNYTGGTLMQFMLLDIAGNFRESDAESMQILQLIFDIEDTLVASGDLLPHFAMIIARP
jgi:ubiquinone/menaquinone biosynthesis C-methylase UbiE|tara:strand:- start:126 stop:1058 length:933 start_codon:yes stop_codon:yes gene_type:complete